MQALASQIAMQTYAASIDPVAEDALAQQVNIRLMRAAAGVS
jgi:hypothetical protein